MEKYMTSHLNDVIVGQHVLSHTQYVSYRTIMKLIVQTASTYRYIDTLSFQASEEI